MSALLVTVTCPCSRWVMKILDRPDGWLCVQHRSGMVMNPPEEVRGGIDIIDGIPLAQERRVREEWFKTAPKRNAEPVRESDLLRKAKVLTWCTSCDGGKRVWNDMARGLYVSSDDVAAALVEARRDGKPDELVAQDPHPGKRVSLDEALTRLYGQS